MKYRLQDLIDIGHFQDLQDRLNEIYSFPSAIVDNDGHILTATAWQDICTQFHRQNSECERECIKSDQYILSHIAEANPAVSYRCPHGLVDNATPIIVDGVHLGNFFTGQFFLEEPDLDFFRSQAQRYGFDEEAYLEAVKRVPVWTQAQLDSYLSFIKGLIEVISETGLKNLRGIEARKRAEESEKQFQAMFDLASIGIAQTDPRSGQWVRVNQKMFEITGYTAKELLSLRVCDITHPEDRERDRNAIQRLIRGDAPDYRIEKRYIRKDGKVAWVNVNMTLILDDAGQPTLTMATIEDITGRKESEEALREGEARLRLALDAAQAGIWEWDFTTNKNIWSDDVWRLYGLDRNTCEASYETWRQAIHPDDLPATETAVSTAAACGREIAIEWRVNVAKGPERWLMSRGRPRKDKSGTVTGYSGIVVDITGRKQAEQALRESEQRYRSLFDGMINGLAYGRVIHEEGKPPDFVYLDVNAAHETLTGLKNVVGRRVSEVIPGIQESDPGVLEAYVRVASTGVPERFEAYAEALKMWFSISLYSPRRDHFVALFDVITERKRTEEMLRESQAQLEAALASMVDAVFISDTAGHFIHFNDAFATFHRFNDKNECARTLSEYPNFLEVFTADGTLAPLDMWAVPRALRGETASNAEYTLRRKDTGETWIGSYSFGPIRGKDGAISGAVVVGRDITEQRLAEERTRQLAAIVKYSDDAIVGKNMEGIITSWNKGAERIYGYTEAEAVGSSVSMLVPPEHCGDMPDFLALIARGEHVEHFETVRRRKDGTLIDVSLTISPVRDGAGRIVGASDTARDITARRRSEEALRESEDRMRFAFIASHTGAWDLDLVNHSAFRSIEHDRIFGYEQMLPQWTYEMFLEHVLPEDRAEVDRKFQEAMQTQGNWDFECRIVRRDGEQRWIWACGQHRRSGQGSPVRIAGIVQDITERKLAELEKARLEDQLQQAHKMETVGRLAGGVAHDFNNMLGVILGHSDIALEQVEAEHPVREDIAEIRKAAERSADLTRRLLTFARKQIIAPRVLDLNDVVSGMLKMLQRMLGEDIHLEWHPSTFTATVKMDPSQIDQILANLCVNARDAISDVGKITIETGQRIFDAEYCADNAGFVPGEYVVLAVSDDGCGMDKQTLASIFEPFFTTKPVGQGTGLGLATVYGAVRQNNGFINVYSEPGEGTTFSIYLPRHAGNAKETGKEKALVPDLRGNETILLTEDEPSVLNMTAKLLEGLGYSVLAAQTPGAAISAAKEHPGEIHLLLTDVVMPNMNGRDLANRLSSDRPRLKHLFMSGYTANVIAHHGVLDDGMHFIQKPFSATDLAKRVRETLDGE